jgi:hypothetical protein
MSKDLVIASLTTTSGTNNHETVSDLNSIIQLDDLIYKRLNGLQVLRDCRFFDLIKKGAIINVRLLDTREQISDDILE